MTIQNELSQFITGQLLAENGSMQLGADDNLLLSGLIDSHAVIRLVNFIEEQFDVKVHPGEVTLKNFKTVNAMVAFINNKTAVARNA
jgi:methoxymalonate biosynthesis acyl carrier protein